MAERPEDAVALSDKDIEDMALEPSDHHLEPENRDDIGSDEPPVERPTRARRRPQARAETRAEPDEAAEESSRAGKGEEEEEEAARPAARRGEEPLELEEEGLPAEEPAPAPVDETKGRPFKFKASGAESVFEGLTEMPDGSLRGSKEAAHQVRQLLASHVELRRTSTDERRKNLRTIEQLKTERTAKDVEADRIASFLPKFEEMDEDALYQWAIDFKAKLPELKLQIKEDQIAQREKQLEARSKGEVLLPEEQEEVFTQTVQQEVRTTFERLLKVPEARYLTKDDREKLWAKWIQKGGRLVSTQGDDTVFDDQEIVDDFIERIELRRDQAKAVQNGNRNAALNADQRPGSRPPPTVRGGKPPAREAEGERQKKYGRGERRKFKKDFMAGRLDSQEEE